MRLPDADDDVGGMSVAPDAATGRLDVADELASAIGDQHDRIGSSLDRAKLFGHFCLGRRPFVRLEQHEARLAIEGAFKDEQRACVLATRLPADELAAQNQRRAT
jgi:hypothetical protein